MYTCHRYECDFSNKNRGKTTTTTNQTQIKCIHTYCIMEKFNFLCTLYTLNFMYTLKTYYQISTLLSSNALTRTLSCHSLLLRTNFTSVQCTNHARNAYEFYVNCVNNITKYLLFRVDHIDSHKKTFSSSTVEIRFNHKHILTWFLSVCPHVKRVAWQRENSRSFCYSRLEYFCVIKKHEFNQVQFYFHWNFILIIHRKLFAL